MILITPKVVLFHDNLQRILYTLCFQLYVFVFRLFTCGHLSIRFFFFIYYRSRVILAPTASL